MSAAQSDNDCEPSGPPASGEPAQPAADGVDPTLSAAQQQASASEPPAQPPEPAAEPTLEEQLAEAREGAERTRQQLLRVAADYDNFRKRSTRELEDERRRARHGVLRELLPVFDNLERAGVHVGDATDAAAIGEGIRMVLKQFTDTLARLGIERVEAEARPFDPGVHESIQLVDSDDVPAGIVVSVAQAGYRQGDELIRPALVVVSKGPAAPPPVETTADEPSAEPAEPAAPGSSGSNGSIAGSDSEPQRGGAPDDLGGDSG
jgi:molecular chaperone GrpE